LILNLLLLLAALSLFGATLTLPGIAGVILTIGMGVDSNVLVFERVREELRNGKSAAAAVDAGFDKAFLTIIDTHVTTVVSAFFLFWFGTGPIKGFAVTWIVGLIANVFTAIFVSKTIFQYHLSKMERQAELSIQAVPGLSNLPSDPFCVLRGDWFGGPESAIWRATTPLDPPAHREQ